MNDLRGFYCAFVYRIFHISNNENIFPEMYLGIDTVTKPGFSCALQEVFFCENFSHHPQSPSLPG